MTESRQERPFAQARRQAGLDLYRAAGRLGIHPRYLRALELSRRPLAFDLARRMAREYGVDINRLTRPADSP